METDDVITPPGPGAIAACPFTIDRPVMRQRWERLTFLHWAFDPAVVQSLLPAGLQADTLDGQAWVGLVPFFMRVGTPADHRAPWISNFCETNVRTYVRDQDGQRGIWFFSLEAARLGAVTVARAAYGLPYYWAAMRLAGRGDQIAYASARRWPGPRGTASRVRVTIGAPYRPGEASDRDHFLTARWMLFSAAGRGLRFARAWHEPWPLHHAAAGLVDDHLIRAAGLPAPQGPPLVHYSPGVDVRIGRPERYSSGRR